MANDQRRFEVFVSYYVSDPNTGQVRFGNIFINIDVTRNGHGYLPQNLTGQMIMQLRAQIAVQENVDEEAVFVANMFLAESPPRIEENNGDENSAGD